MSMVKYILSVYIYIWDGMEGEIMYPPVQDLTRTQNNPFLICSEAENTAKQRRLWEQEELRSCVKIEVDVPRTLYGHCGCTATLKLNKR